VSEAMAPPVAAHAEDVNPSWLLAFKRLDDVLGRAVEGARKRFGPEAPTDPFRGLYVSAEHAERSLGRPAGEPLLAEVPRRQVGPEPGWDRIAAGDQGWAWLRATYGLSDFELDVILLALAPEVDGRYERLYGYLQDDVSRKRPTVGLALDLLTATAEERLAARGAFGTDGALLGRRVLTLVPDPRAVSPPLIARFLALDEQIVDILLEQGGLDRRLASCCHLLTPPPGHGEDCDRVLLRMVDDAWGRHPLRLYFHGPRGAGQRRTAEALAGELAVPLLVVEAGRLPDEDAALDLVFREASLHGALLYIDDVSSPCELSLADRLADYHGVVIVAGNKPWTPTSRRPLGVLTVSFARGDAPKRRMAWERTLASYGAEAAPGDLDALAGRFRLGSGQIEDAVLTALTAARLRIAGDAEATTATPTREELFAAARGQTGHELTALARRIEPSYGWDDIVLTADSLAQLHDLCDWVAYRRRVMDEWGFNRRVSQGQGISALFAGPPGTGKTMAAEVIAHEVGLDLFKIDLSMVVSKYIGETEKNLERVFTAAADADAILLFDEADALFGKRSDVHDAHDRYANIEIAYLLQRMEQYDGLAILATNMRKHLDDAFTRRLQFVVEFPFPDDAERRRIWEVCFPPRAPCDAGLDLERLARDFRLSGGNIRNIVLHAAFLAAAQDTRIGMAQLLQATGREYQKMGKVVPAGGLGDGRERE